MGGRGHAVEASYIDAGGEAVTVAFDRVDLGRVVAGRPVRDVRSRATDDGRRRAFELGQRLGCKKSRLHHQLTRMCARGLVQRHSGAGRAIHAAVTDAGRAALEAAVPRHRQQVRRLVLDQSVRRGRATDRR